VLGAGASVQVALVSPLDEHGFPRHSLRSVQAVVPVPVYAGLLQLQVYVVDGGPLSLQLLPEG
jgi:hypothetical protein